MGGAHLDVTLPSGSECAFVSCWLNGVQCQALIDSGAQATIVSKSLFNRIKSPTTALQPQRKHVFGANNLPLDVTGEAAVVIQLGGVMAKQRVYICRGLAQEVLIGIDFFKAHKCVLNFESATISTIKGESKMSFQSSNRVCRVQVAESVILPPNMVVDIPCKVQDAGRFANWAGVLEPEDKFGERYGAGVFRTAVTVKNSCIPVRAFNPSNKPLKIYRCSTVGTLHPLVESKGITQEDMNGISYNVVARHTSDIAQEEVPGVTRCNTLQVEGFERCCAYMAELFPITDESVTEEEKRRHYEVLANHVKCISQGPMDLGHARGVQHTIDTGSASPIQVPPRRVPFHKREEMRRQVDEMLEAGVTLVLSCGAGGKT